MAAAVSRAAPAAADATDRMAAADAAFEDAAAADAAAAPSMAVSGCPMAVAAEGCKVHPNFAEIVAVVHLGPVVGQAHLFGLALHLGWLSYCLDHDDRAGVVYR